MRVSVSEANGQPTELVRRAEAGDEVILTRHGHPAVRLVPEGGGGQEVSAGAAGSGARIRSRKSSGRAQRCA